MVGETVGREAGGVGEMVHRWGRQDCTVSRMGRMVKLTTQVQTLNRRR